MKLNKLIKDLIDLSRELNDNSAEVMVSNNIEEMDYLDFEAKIEEVAVNKTSTVKCVILQTKKNT